MSRTLVLRNRQRDLLVNPPLLRRLIRHLLARHFQVTRFELGVHLVAREEMAHLNETFLQHEGSTDVITFDHAEAGQGSSLHGEIFICLEDVATQAGRFHTTWPSELVRCIIHGLLHLQGYDDLEPARRRRMKREENRLLGEMAREFRMSEIEKSRPPRAQRTLN